MTDLQIAGIILGACFGGLLFNLIWLARVARRSSPATTVKIRAEWAAICQEIENLLEQLNRLDGRIKKRESRARLKPPKDDQEAPVPSPASVKPWKSRKDQLRARLRGGGIPGPTPPIQMPPDPELEETGT